MPASLHVRKSPELVSLEPAVRSSGSLDTWRRALGVLLLGAVVTACMDRLLFAGEARVGDLRGLHLAWSVAATVTAAAAACLVWPRHAVNRVDLTRLPEAPLLRLQRRLLAHSFSRSFAHDGNNVLLALRFRIAELARVEQERVRGLGGTGGDAASLVHEMGHACDELEVLLARLRELGTVHDALHQGPVDLELVLPRIIDFASGHADVRVAAPTLDVDPQLIVIGDTILLRQMVTNLLLNASQASGRASPVAVRARRGAGHVIIEVHDAGPGMPVAESSVDSISPFSSDGSGLGLWAAKAIAESLGGTLSFDHSDDLGGTCVRVSLPAAGVSEGQGASSA
ncbi:MAG: hypothetical protein DRQ55_09255 [Planctomycetota bacterium]|nr:MAG: hypothetical protein DRQ55_09255 [Planctomycetota bacterium]